MKIEETTKDETTIQIPSVKNLLGGNHSTNFKVSTYEVYQVIFD